MLEQRVKKVRQKLEENNLEALLVTKPENRRYISGFTGSAGMCLITANASFLLTDFRYTEQATAEAPYFKVLEPENCYYKKIFEILNKEGISKVAFEKDYVNYKSYEKMRQTFTNIELIPIEGIIEDLRKIKDSTELEFLKKAISISDAAFEHILDYIKPGITERDIALELEFFMKRNGAEDIAFTTIVASGQRSSLPHGTFTSKKIASGDLITMDFGAVYKGYHSDLTRTVCVGNPGAKEREIYELVLEAQIEAENNIKPGMTCKEADNIARSIIAKKDMAKYFGHSLGHGVGLAIHEAPHLSSRNEEILEEGMVVTVEPGVYIPGWGGVRIEDIVLITKNGAQVLTKSPKEFISL